MAFMEWYAIVYLIYTVVIITFSWKRLGVLVTARCIENFPVSYVHISPTEFVSFSIFCYDVYVTTQTTRVR